MIDAACGQARKTQNMRSFIEIEQAASSLHSGMPMILRGLVLPKSPDKIKIIPDEKWLSAMSKIVFQAGFNWKIIDNKWPSFENLFLNFSISFCNSLSDEKLEELMMSGKIVKNWNKVKAIQKNAAYLQSIIEKHGSVGNYFSDWKIHCYGINMHNLQSQGSRMGGKTGQIFLRRMGVDTLVFSNDVMISLKRECQIGSIPKSKKSWLSMQSIIDQWHADSGRSLNEISQILAFKA